MAKPRDHADRAPSTAWLAAQEAFSAPRPSPAEPALVVLRKARAPELVLQGDAPSSSPAAAAVPTERPARVFRVVAAAAVGTAAAAGTALALLDEGAEWSAVSAPKRRRRVDLHKDPGPVKHILQATPAPIASADGADTEPTVRRLSNGEEMAALRAAMAHLDAVFDDISRARGFRFLIGS